MSQEDDWIRAEGGWNGCGAGAGVQVGLDGSRKFGVKFPDTLNDISMHLPVGKKPDSHNPMEKRRPYMAEVLWTPAWAKLCNAQYRESLEMLSHPRKCCPGDLTAGQPVRRTDFLDDQGRGDLHDSIRRRVERLGIAMEAISLGKSWLTHVN